MSAVRYEARDYEGPMPRQTTSERLFYRIARPLTWLVILLGCATFWAVGWLLMDAVAFRITAHATIPPLHPRVVTVIEYQPSENVAVLGKYRCQTHGGLIGYYVGLYAGSDYEVDCADHSSYTAHGGMKVSN